MSKIVNINSHKNKLVGEEIGSVHVFMYKDVVTGKPFFYIEADNEDVLQLSYVIEDTLYYF